LLVLITPHVGTISVTRALTEDLRNQLINVIWCARNCRTTPRGSPNPNRY
jgi:hypothetical protein